MLNPYWERDTDSKRVFKDAIERLHGQVIHRLEWQNVENRAMAELLLERLEANWNGYKRISMSLEQYINDQHGELRAADELHEVATWFDQARRTLNRHIDTLKRMEVTYVPKISDIILPKFGGKHTEWSPWAANVKASVHDAELPVHSKIMLITNALDGAAKKCVGQAEGQDLAELDRIWSKLTSVYENKYQLTRAHLAMIIDLPTLASPSAIKLQIMIDTTEHALRALDRLGIQTHSWDPIVCDIILRKFDGATLKAWEMNRDINTLPNLAALFEFLKKRIQAIRNLDRLGDEHEVGAAHGNPKRPRRDDEHRDDRRENNRREWKNEREKSAQQAPSREEDAVKAAAAEALKKYGPCPYRPICQNKVTHYLWNSKAFRRLANPERIKLIDEKRICKRCLIGSHDSGTCTGRTCGNCTDDLHNYLLCPKHKVMASAASDGA